MSTEPDHLKHAIRQPTAIVRDMQTTARELGIVDLLLQHQRILLDRGTLDEPYDLVEEVLVRLGVTNAELLANLGPAE